MFRRAQGPMADSTTLALDTRRRGVTLVEVSITGVVLAMLSASMAVTIGSSLRATRLAEEHDAARQVSAGILEQIESWPDFSTVPAFDGTAFDVPGLEPPTQLTRVGSVTVDTSEPDLLRVIVRAEWMGAMGIETVELVTLVVDRKIVERHAARWTHAAT